MSPFKVLTAVAVSMLALTFGASYMIATFKVDPATVVIVCTAIAIMAAITACVVTVYAIKRAKDSDKE